MGNNKPINTAILCCFLLVLLTTTVLAEATVRFAIIGDFGNRTSSGAEADVAAMVSGWNPEFVITTGDNRYEGDDYNNDVGQFYCEFMADAQSGSFCSGNESGINRFFPSLGNHDYLDGGGVNEYLDYFTLPGTGVASTSGSERYYDFVKGPVHFFVLDSQRARTSSSNKTLQQNWLQTQLANSTARWNIVYFHHPAYTSGTSDPRDDMKWPFASWGADVVFAGHDHVYERIATQGITYFINGLGGDILGTFLATPVSGSQVRYSDDHGAMLVNASDTAITFKLISRTDGLVDTYTLGNWIPTDIALSNTTVPENTNTSGGYLVATLSSTDEDTKPPETASYSIVGGADRARFSITNGNKLILTDGILDYETKSSYVVTIRVTDSALNTYSETFTITVTNINDAPTVALSNPTTTLPESTVVTSRIKVANIVITDDALGTNTLSLSGADAALFEIVSGALYLKAGTVLDFETNPSLEVTVAVDDAAIPGSPEGTAALVITVTNVNEAPTVALSNPTTTLPESTVTTSRVKVANIVITDDALGTNTLSLSGADAALFEIVSGALYLKAGTVLDFETNPSLEVTVAVDDAAIPGSPEGTAALVITVTNVNEAPTVALSNPTTTLPESTVTTSRVKVANIVITDDALGTNTLSLSGADAALFEIVSGALYLKAGTVLDFETNPSLEVTVAVDDAAIPGSPEGTAALVITVTNVNEAPTVALSNPTTTLPESTVTTSRVKVANIVITDDALGTNTLSLSGADVTLFEIVSGALYLKAGTVLDFETNPSLEVTVAVDDAAIPGSPEGTAALVITVTNVNEAPTADFTYNCTDLDCSFTDTSTDSDGTVTGWSWTFGDGASSTQQNPSPSYATAGTYTVNLTVTDNVGATDNTIQILAVEEAVVLKGDVNGDGQLNAADLLIASQILLGTREPTVDELEILDVAPLVNGVPAPDGDFNLGDYLVLQKMVME